MNRRRLALALLLVLACLALRVCLLAWLPRDDPAPRHTGTATAARTAPAGRVWQLGGKDATVHFSTWPLSRTKPTTISFQLGDRELDLLKEAMASTTAVVGEGREAPVRPNRFARVVTVRQSGVTLYEKKATCAISPHATLAGRAGGERAVRCAPKLALAEARRERGIPHRHCPGHVPAALSSSICSSVISSTSSASLR